MGARRGQTPELRRSRATGTGGFTLVELLVVMVVIGALAAIAVPTLLIQKRKAHEASVKSDIKQVAKEVAAFYVDGTGPLVLEAGPQERMWQLRQGPSVVVTGPLSRGNAPSVRSTITSDTDYCVALVPELDGASAWHSDGAGLARGDC